MFDEKGRLTAVDVEYRRAALHAERPRLLAYYVAGPDWKGREAVSSRQNGDHAASLRRPDSSRGHAVQSHHRVADVPVLERRWLRQRLAFRAFRQPRRWRRLAGL